MVKRNVLQNSTPSAVEKTIKGLGENLRTARLRRKLTIKEVADKIGVGIRVVSDAEHGKPATSIKVYMALLWVYDLLESTADFSSTKGCKIKERECRLLFSVEGFLRKRFGSVWTRMRPEAVCGQARFGDNSVGKLRGIL